MRKKSEPTISAEQLIAWRGKRSQVAAAKELKTPWRTYVGWERGESRVPGAVSAFVDLDYETRPKK